MCRLGPQFPRPTNGAQFSEEGIFCKVRKRRYRSFKGGEEGSIAPNILRRDFAADMPNQKWVTDVTEFNVAGTKIYLSPIMDLFNSEIVSYSVATSPGMNMVENMLQKAFQRLRPCDAPILHSDQGWQYQQRRYHRALKDRGITQSMSRRGNCLDNASMESFFGHLKCEFYRGRRFASVERFVSQLEDYIAWYNNERIKTTLGGHSPVGYRLSRTPG